ncbi:MAG: biotin carboxylase N-terminal domain-containing protein [Polyangiaceae bacterium]|nr:biotin carboxylase N-terminal domain-containing protein [Polyangiaceae bacterium]
MFNKVLVANRGEIACRILRTCERLGVHTVAVFSDADVTGLPVSHADEAVRLGPAPAKESYLNIPSLVAAIEYTGAEAVHPGYGLLSENADFARAVAEAGAVFIGPPPAALEVFGDKIAARRLARAAGVEPPPGSEGPLDPEATEAVKAEAARIGYPLLVKAAGGGGGIGMQIVEDEPGLEQAVKTCAARGQAAFADPRVYLERYIKSPRHIEVQVFCDSAGHAVALGERECSVQRRHQKVIEESPSPAAFFDGLEGEARRQELFASALRIVKSAGYVGAGTVEFVADAAGQFYFLEVNARLQVEHPVTEMVTGLDLVELQLRVASGEALSATALNVKCSGVSLEARVYAEDPARGFIPQPGKLTHVVWPSGPGIRVEAGVEVGSEVSVHYDPLLAKIVAFAPTRAEAVARLDLALSHTELTLMGPKGERATNLSFLRSILGSSAFQSGQYSTDLIANLLKPS